MALNPFCNGTLHIYTLQNVSQKTIFTNSKSFAYMKQISEEFECKKKPTDQYIYMPISKFKKAHHQVEQNKKKFNDTLLVT